MYLFINVKEAIAQDQTGTGNPPAGLPVLEGCIFHFITIVSSAPCYAFGMGIITSASPRFCGLCHYACPRHPVRFRSRRWCQDLKQLSEPRLGQASPEDVTPFGDVSRRH
ncbi:hypothetical protein RRG08_011733 [Elysia crispata]|uniref:Uncharacterized protein n=1 Tax=Elysia crispata TaxID=231223 RepID=A0AAE1AGR1_9GAST|nr:hypothetical protein RRG08_011733 [Elysia crispata]